jgi:putative membrane protein
MWLGRFGFGHMLPWLAWVGPLVMVVFWALFVTALVMLIVHLARQSRSSHSGTALSILKERYAKGEINKDEFDRMKKDIQGQANHTPNGPVEEIFRWQRMRPLPTKVVAGASFVSAAEQERS